MEWKWKIWHTNGSFVFFTRLLLLHHSIQSNWVYLHYRNEFWKAWEREKLVCSIFVFFCQFPGKKSHQKEKKTIFYYLIERAREKMMIISIVFNDGGYKIIIIIIIIIFLEISRFRVFIIIQQQQQQLSKWTCTPTLNT